ncbi:MAG: response regulator [Labilithrix sp.]
MGRAVDDLAAQLAALRLEHAQTRRALLEAEERLGFLHELATIARMAPDANALLRASLTLLGQKLGVSRCVYGELDPDEDRIFVAQDYCDGCASIVGEHRLSSFGPRFASALRSGKEPFVVTDVHEEFPEVEAKVFAAIELRSVVACALIRHGKLRALMSVNHNAPRLWSKHEVSLVQETVERCWSAIEQRAAESRLRENIAQLRIAGMAAKVGGWSVDLASRRVLWSEQLYALHEVPLGSPPSMKDALASCAPEFQAIANKTMNACIRDGTPFDTELQIITATGRRVWIRAIGAPERNAAGKIIRIHGALQDIDERRRLEDQLRQAEKMDAIGRLAGGVAHDFNNLLSVILSYSAFMIGGLPIDDPLRGDLEQIHGAGKRASELTRQLLTFSSQQATTPRRLDVREVVSGFERMLRRVLDNGVTFAVIRPESLAAIFADQGQIEQVIMNLVLNASDAVGRNGKITVEMADVLLDETYAAEHHGVTAGPHVMLAVTDNGHGMDESTRERIFEPFFTTKEKGKGTGLGLATVYGIVTQSGGHIWVYSEVGVGTTFKVYFPQTNEPAEAARTPTEQPSRPAMQQGTETILVVEDAEAVRAITCAILRRAGYVVLSASSATDALQLCKRHEGRIDLLLTDVVLPHTMGRELAASVKKLRPEIHVLYMSGYTGDAAVKHGLLDPGVAFLPKPITPDALLAKAREVLSPATVRREHILHVDDEETLVVLTARILQRIGYRVTSFTDSQEALEAFAKAPGDFDAVVTDIDMPGLNGFQLVQALRRERVDVPIVVTSGAFRAEDVRTAESLGLHALVVKPNTVDELGRVLHEELKASAGKTAS